MKHILIIGAGRSSSSLIAYLNQQAIRYNWQLLVADASLELAKNKVATLDRAKAICFDVFDEDQRHKLINQSDVVISMLPAAFHIHVAKTCLALSKHLLTASYISPEMQQLDEEVKAKGLVFLNEMGLDPGIDHLSAMELIARIKGEGGEIVGFKSFCGGLVAPESDTNPWGYKFTWNPRNVVLAGQGTVKYIVNNEYKYTPYHKLFTQTESIQVPGYGDFDGYANRDSLSYRKAYGLDSIPTILRGTLRKAGFCSAWNIFVQLGMTDDTYKIENSELMTYCDFVKAYLPFSDKLNIEQNLASYLNLAPDSPELYKLRWLGILENDVIGLKNATPAQILQQLLEKKWKLEAHDKDMIVMQHLIDYKLNSANYRVISSMVVIGEDTINTAMAKTVGLPLAIACKLLLNNQLSQRGVFIPTNPELYEPVLAELAEYGIVFTEKSEKVG